MQMTRKGFYFGIEIPVRTKWKFKNVKVSIFSKFDLVKSCSKAGYIPRERFLDPPPAPPPINFVHGSDRKCLNLT